MSQVQNNVASVKRVRTDEDKAHRAMKRPHQQFIDSLGGKESEFTNGYTWGFVAGYKAALRAARRVK